jgi:hypothetical protein
LTDEEGRLNFINAIVIGNFINLFLSRSVESCALLFGSFALLAFSWKLLPQKSRKVTVDELDLAKEQSREALDQIKKLNLKLGFRAS